MVGWTGGWSGMNSIRRVLWVLLVLLAGGAFARDEGTPRIHPARHARTVDVQLLPLSGPLAEPQAEVSGLTWKDGELVVLPQFPDLFGQKDILGFFTLAKADIHSRLLMPEPTALIPTKIDCQAAGLMRIIRGFDGLEAMGIMGDRVYMTIEAKEDTTMAGYIVCGHYNMVDDHVIIDMTRLTSIPLGVNIYNVAEESMIISGEKVITFSEANGRNVIDQPRAKVFDKTINFLGSIPFPSIEYRVTDATDLDDKGRFWVINYYYPGDEEKLRPGPDPEVEKFGLPEDWVEGDCIERLLELQLIDDQRIVRTETPPINLRIRADGKCRNWEALVRLDDAGFLMMTDKYPGTLLAFVPNPFNR